MSHSARSTFAPLLSPGALSVASRLAELTLADRLARDRDAITVLIVDDIRETPDHLQNFLTFESDIKVVGVAATGIEALEVANRLSPDVVLMDIFMPEMSGLTQRRSCSNGRPRSL